MAKTTSSSKYANAVTADTLGQPIPLSCGTREVAGHMIWSTSVVLTSGDATSSAGTSSGSSSGVTVPVVSRTVTDDGTDDATKSSLASSAASTTTDSTTTTDEGTKSIVFAVSFGYQLVKGRNEKIQRLVANGTTIYDEAANYVYPGLSITTYNGSEEQTPDPTMESYLGAGNVPAYRGQAYAVIAINDLSVWGTDTIPSVGAVLSDVSGDDVIAAFATLPNAQFSGLDFAGAVYDKVSGHYAVRVFADDSLNNGKNALRIFDVTTKSEIKQVAMATGLVASQSGMILSPDAKRVIASHNSNVASAPVAAQDIDTGALIADRPNVPLCVKWATTRDGNTDYYLGVGQYNALVLLRGASLDFVVTTNNPSDGKTSGAYPVRALAGGGGGLFFGSGPNVYRIFPSQSTSSGLRVQKLTTFDSQYFDTITALVYDDDDGSLIISAQGSVGCAWRKIDANTGSTVWETSTPSGFALDAAHATPFSFSDTSNGKLCFIAAGGAAYCLQKSSGQLSGLGIVAHIPQSYIYFGPNHSFIGVYNGQVIEVTLERGSAEDMPLADVLRAIPIAAGVAATDVLVDDSVDDKVTGAYIAASDQDAFALMQALADAYSLDLLESGGVITFRKKAFGSVTPLYAIPLDDIALQSSEELPQETSDDPFANASIITTREGEESQYRGLQLSYLDASYSHSNNTVLVQKARLPTDDVDQMAGIWQLSIPVIITAATAQTIAARALFSAFEARTSHSLRLPQKYANLEPSDIVTLDSGSYTYLAKITRVTYNTDFSLSVEAVNFLSDTSAIKQNGQTPIDTKTNPVDPNTGQPTGVDTTLGPAAVVQPIVIELPYLSAEVAMPTDKLNLYVGGRRLGVSPGRWTGGIFYVQNDLGGLDAQFTIANELVTGSALNALPDIDTRGSIDDLNYIDVALVSGEASALESTDYLGLVGNRNWIAIGAPGRWELISWQIATKISDKVVRLSTLIRGLRGTEIFSDQHAAGDAVIFIDPNALRGYQVPVAKLNATMTFGLSTPSGSASSALTVAATIDGTAEKPFAPVGIKAVRQPNSDLILTWNRQSRNAPEFTEADVTDVVPLDEPTEAYEIDILAAAGGVVVKTITGLTAPTYTLTAADQTSASLDLASVTLTVRVYEISPVVGRGFTKERTLNVQ